MIEKCDFRFFFLQKISLWIRSRDHAWSSHRLCFDCSTRIFSRWRTRSNSIFRNDKNLTKRFIKLDESDSSNLTNNISSNLMSCISSNLMNDISSNLTNEISLNLTNDTSSNLTSDISSNLINDISSNFTRTLSVFLSKRSWMTSLYVMWNLICHTRMSIDEFWDENWTDFVMSVLRWKLKRWHNLTFEWKWTSNYIYRFAVRVHNLSKV